MDCRQVNGVPRRLYFVHSTVRKVTGLAMGSTEAAGFNTTLPVEFPKVMTRRTQSLRLCVVSGLSDSQWALDVGAPQLLHSAQGSWKIQTPLKRLAALALAPARSATHIPRLVLHSMIDPCRPKDPWQRNCGGTGRESLSVCSFWIIEMTCLHTIASRLTWPLGNPLASSRTQVPDMNTCHLPST